MDLDYIYKQKGDFSTQVNGQFKVIVHGGRCPQLKAKFNKTQCLLRGQNVRKIMEQLLLTRRSSSIMESFIHLTVDHYQISRVNTVLHYGYHFSKMNQND